MNETDVKKEIAVTVDRHQLDEARSYFYRMNAKPDCKSRAFSRRVTVDKDDIIDLNDRVQRKIQMFYQEEGYVVTVSANLKKREAINFSTWDEFRVYDWYQTSNLESLIVQWTFNIKMPGYELPQKHSLVVKLCNGLRPEEMLNLIFSGKIEDFEEVELNTFPVVAKVDFIQALLADELLNIVSEWVAGLKSNAEIKNPIIMLLRKYRKYVAQIIEYVSLVLTTVLLLAIICNYLTSLGIQTMSQLTILQLENIIRILGLGAIFVYFAKMFFAHVAQQTYDMLTEYGNVFIFNITKGDKNLQDEICKKDKIQIRRILWRVIISGVFNIACGWVSAILF